jgi:hypothetical protein
MIDVEMPSPKMAATELRTSIEIGAGAMLCNRGSDIGRQMLGKPFSTYQRHLHRSFQMTSITETDNVG